MPEAVISNPNKAFGYTDGEQVNWYLAIPVLLDGIVVKGDVLAFTAQSTNIGMLAHAADTDNDDPALCKSVARTAGAVGDTIMAVIQGYALVNIGSDTPAVGERLNPGATAGVAAAVAADATTIAGDTFGTCLGSEVGATNQVAAWIGQ